MFMFSRILSADYEAMRQRYLVRTHEKKNPQNYTEISDMIFTLLSK